MAGLNMGIIQSLPVRLPSIFHQKAIIAKIDSLSSKVSRLEAFQNLKLAKIDELKKSILQKAFTGGLTSASTGLINEAAE